MCVCVLGRVGVGRQQFCRVLAAISLSFLILTERRRVASPRLLRLAAGMLAGGWFLLGITQSWAC